MPETPNFVGALERRQDRLEEVIDRLTGISSDLSKMIAVHEQRLSHQERQLISVEEVVEKRREEYQTKLDLISDRIEQLRHETASSHAGVTDRIAELEKLMWRYGGGLAVIAFVLAYGPNILRILALK